MPSCANFGVIDQYLSLRDQVDSEDEFLSVNDSVAQFLSSSFLLAETADVAKSGTELPINFLDMDNKFLEEVTGSRVTATPVSFDSTMKTTGGLTPTFPSFSHVSKAAGSGGTVTLMSSGDQQVTLDENPDLFNMDCGKQMSLFDDSSADAKPAKTATELFPRRDSSLQHGLNVPHGGGASEVSEMSEGVQTFMIESMCEEIMRVCSELNISSDPRNWNHLDTQAWVEYTCRKNQFHDEGFALFNVQGDILCQMRVDDFLWRAPGAGAFLHQNLEIWKMACQILPGPPMTQTLGSGFAAASGSGGACHPTMTPSTSPAPSTDSTCSTLSSASSGGHKPTSFSSWAPDSLDDDAFSLRRPVQPAPHNTPAHVPAAPHRGPRPGKQTIHLWQFLKELLDDPEAYSCIKWIDRTKGIFKIEDSSKVAKLWGRRKNRPAMNYDKLSRSVRQYYKKGIIKKTEMSKRLVYQFCQPYL